MGSRTWCDVNSGNWSHSLCALYECLYCVAHQCLQEDTAMRMYQRSVSPARLLSAAPAADGNFSPDAGLLKCVLWRRQKGGEVREGFGFMLKKPGRFPGGDNTRGTSLFYSSLSKEEEKKGHAGSSGALSHGSLAGRWLARIWCVCVCVHICLL